ncbi:hypothetical protein SADUNF_Sadunf05G0006900 [Salix dunnii]|uniref:BHLH domain-containing protein n=1 Tax=Salix dunnii TaxID=1413687 RepID=A0A835K8W7_9ROSI|nr:hypothetical protein SADUNF_Sadunf05G0006900 [Salix dunnii]
MASNQLNCDMSSQQEQNQQKKKRRKSSLDTTESHIQKDSKNHLTVRWRTEAERRIYSSKLLEALRRSSRTPSHPGKRTREVRETADRVLAVAARGRTRWSRAILAKRARLLRVRKVKKQKSNGDRRLPERERRKLPEVEKKVKALSRLVPGCRKVSFVNLLEEASDYIAALEMQIKVMATLSEILTAAGGEVGGVAGTDGSLSS